MKDALWLFVKECVGKFEKLKVVMSFSMKKEHEIRKKSFEISEIKE